MYEHASPYRRVSLVMHVNNYVANLLINLD
jgi:hypothetical protein